MERTCTASTKKNEGEVEDLDEHGRGLLSLSTLVEEDETSRCLRHCRLRWCCGYILSSMFHPFGVSVGLDTGSIFFSILFIQEVRFRSPLLSRFLSVERRRVAFSTGYSSELYRSFEDLWSTAASSLDVLDWTRNSVTCLSSRLAKITSSQTDGSAEGPNRRRQSKERDRRCIVALAGTVPEGRCPAWWWLWRCCCRWWM